MKARHIALLAVTGTVAAVLGLKKFVTANAAALNGSVIVPGFVDMAFTQNHGISFGLFAQETEFGSWVLVLTTVLIIAALSVWAYRTTQPVAGAALGMIIGGALVNTFDRAFNGTVFDFLFFHVGSFPLFVCNAPDIAISIGFMILVAEELFANGPQSTP